VVFWLALKPPFFISLSFVVFSYLFSYFAFYSQLLAFSQHGFHEKGLPSPDAFPHHSRGVLYWQCNC
jgi:hypothetical protein